MLDLSAKLGAGVAAAAGQYGGSGSNDGSTGAKLDANSKATYDEVDVANVAGHMDLDELEIAKMWE